MAIAPPNAAICASAISMKIISKDPLNYFALQIAAMTLRKLGEAKKSTEFWQISNSVFPKDLSDKELEILERLGDLSIHFHKETYLREKPEALMYTNAAVGFSRRGDIQKAEEYLTKAIQIDPNCELAHFNCGVLAYERKDYQLATNSMKDECMATPAISEGTLFFRTHHYLIAVSDK